MPVNDGQATTRGEFDAKFPLRAFMEDAPAVDIRANGFQLIDGQFCTGEQSFGCANAGKC